MRILVIHQYFVGPGQPGGSRFNEFAQLWTLAGHHVEVVAGNLDYATGVTPDDLKGHWTARRDEEGATVFRCYVPGTYNLSYLGRMWAFFGFTLSSTWATLRASRPDVIIATSPPLTAALTGWFASLWHRVPWVFEVRDLWPESAITTGVLTEGGFLARALFALERFACRRSDAINALTPAFADNLIHRNLARREKIACVSNGADIDRFRPTTRYNEIRHRYGWGERTVALYAGAHGRANALMQLVDAAERLRNRPDILLVTVGDGPERKACEKAAAERGLANLVFLGVRPKNEMPAFVNAADIGLAVLQHNPTFRTVYPNKVFDYMACERPIVLAIDGVARDLVCRRARAGMFAQPENADEIAAAISALADDPALRRSLGTAGRAWVLENASRSALATQYLAVLEGVVQRGRSPAPFPVAEH